MKKIINKKVYDTNTAECVGRWCNGEYAGDLNFCSEDLYRKRTGEFFLYSDGGPRSKCIEIIPLTYESAQKWAEEHLTGDGYEAIFGEVVEDDSRATITLSMSTAAIEQAKRAASQAGISLSAYIESLI